MMNLRWSGIAAVAAFIISLTLGVSVRGQILIIILRALAFGVVFFILAAIIWRLINRYLPELLQTPSPQDSSLMEGMESGSRVNITVGEGDESIPPDAVIPPEETSDDSVGNITERISGGSAPVPVSVPFESPVVIPPQDLMGAGPSPAPGMDLSPQSGYTQSGSEVSEATPSPVSVPTGGFPGASGLGNMSGGIESLPDLDAMAGTFLSSDAGGGEDTVAPPRPYGGSETTAPRSKKGKGKDMGEDFNPKELASAIQTILKRD
jgi:hypothetical protein